MFLLQPLLLLPTATILLQLSQMTASASAFLSPVRNHIRKQLGPIKNHCHPSVSSQYHPSCTKIGPDKTSLNLLSASTVLTTTTTTAVIAELLDTSTADFEDISTLPIPPLPTTAVEGLSPTTITIVFALGLIPFIWATYEFWSRIAVGASFGTGADSVIIRPGAGSTDSDGDGGVGGGGTSIGEDGNPSKSRGRKVLGDDALVVAYVLFAVAIGSVGIAVYSVVSSPLPPM